METRNRGFTLIELVIVVLMLGLLAAFALPRFMKSSDKAKTAIVKHTGGAFMSGITLARAQWMLNEQTTGYLDIDGDGIPQMRFNSNGYPVGISTDGKTPLSEIKDGGVAGHDTCAQIMRKVVQSSGISVIAANEKGKCRSGDFCAIASKSESCQFVYRTTNEKIVYNSANGEVKYP